MAKTKPESWQGETVMVALAVRSPKEFEGRLEEVTDRGVILVLSPNTTNEVEAFYPWSSVRRLRLKSKKEKMQAPARNNPEGRLPGDPGWFS